MTPQNTINCWENLPGPERPKRLTTVALHQKFIKGTYAQSVSWVAARWRGYPLCYMAGTKELYRTGQDEWGYWWPTMDKEKNALHAFSGQCNYLFQETSIEVDQIVSEGVYMKQYLFWSGSSLRVQLRSHDETVSPSQQPTWPDIFGAFHSTAAEYFFSSKILQN